MAFRRIIAIAAVLLLISAALPAQEGGPALKFEDRPVRRIAFDPPDQPFPTTHLLEVLPIKQGDRFHERDLPAAIQALFSTGRFADVAVDASEEGSGVALRFMTKRAYFIGRVDLTGVRDPPNRGQLISATKLSLGLPYHQADKARAIDSLKALLKRNGFYNVSIVASERYVPPTEQVNIAFDVDTGPRARFEQPEITGNPERSPAAIIRSTKWRRMYGLFGWTLPTWGIPDWQQVTDARLQQGLDNVRRYYQKRDLLLARVDLKQLDYRKDTNTVKPTLDVDGGPTITIRAEGAKLRRGKLRQLVPVYQERSLDENLLLEGERNIVQYLQGQGFFEAAVTHSQRDEDGGKRKVITYTIDRGDRHKVVLVRISGNHYFNEKTLRERLYVTPAQFPRFPHGRYSGDLLDRDLQSITDLYQSNGFRNVQVTKNVIDEYDKRENRLAVFINIVEGLQTFVSNLSIDGLDQKGEQEIRSILRSAPGQPFSELNVANDRDSVLAYLYSNGYVNGTFDYETVPAAEPNRMDVRFHVHPGQQRFVRDVLVGGLNTTRSSLVFNRIELSPGDPLSLSKNTDSERALYDLGIFARVDTALQNPDGAETSKYVLYELDEARRYSLNVGVGASIGRIGGGYSLNSPGGAAGFSPRLSLGVSRINFMGLGHTVTFQSLLSNIEQRAGISYIAPQFIGNRNLSLTLAGLYDSARNVRTFSAIRREASVQVAQKLTKADTLQYRIVFRRVTQTDLLIDPLLVPLLAQPVRVGILGMSWIDDRRDDPADSHRGTYTTVDAGYAARFLGSQTVFTRLTFRNSTYYPLSRDLVFARSTFFGWNAPLKGGNTVPIAEHYFAGGATTQRGFPENQAGPRDLETGFPLGGNAVLMNNLELRFPLLGDNLGGVFFLDSGNVYSDIHNISLRFRQENLQDFDYMVHSAGIGFRYRTPIGPMRIDLSFSPNSPRFVGFKGSLQDFLDPNVRPNLPRVTQRINQFQFHFSLGQAF